MRRLCVLGVPAVAEENTQEFATYWRGPWAAGTIGGRMRTAVEVGAARSGRQGYYVPRSGRFLTPDPYRASAALTNPQTWNRYAYVAGDPVNFVDPWGLDGYAVDELWFDGQLQVVTQIDAEGVPVPRSVTVAFLPLQLTRKFVLLFRGRGQHGARLSDQDPTVIRAYARALQALTLNEECEKLYGDPARPGMIKPGELLGELVRGGRYGRIIIGGFQPENPNWAETRPHGWNGSTARTVTIAINPRSEGGYWSQVDNDVRAAGLLHELGHAYYYLFGQNSTRIKYDHPTLTAPGTAEKNDELIQENCF